MSAAVDRYARHRAIAGFSQDVLQASRFAVIGAGAIGNEVVKNLCLLGVGAVDVYDFDVVERHNLTRSVLLREADVGTPKAAAVARHAADLDPAVTVTAIAGDIRDTLGIAAARGYHCVIGALDNFEARLRVNQVCWLAGVDWVNAAIDSRSVSVETFPFAAPDRGTLPGRDAAALPACYECGLPASVYGRIAERYSCGGLLRAALRERVMPTTAITASIAGAQAVDAALKLARAPVHGEPMRGEPVHGEPVHSEQVHSEPVHGEPAARRWWFDTGSGHASGARIARNPACPGCGDLPRRARLVRAADARVATIAAAASAAGATTVRFSDSLVWRCACANCGPTAATRAALLRPARAVSEAIVQCPRCRDATVRVEIRDVVDVDELRGAVNLVPADALLPIRFALAGDVCIEPPDQAEPRVHH